MLIILFLLQTRLINLNKNGNVDSFIKSDLVKKQNS